MSISAQRFKFLDNETNIPIQDFTKIVDNSVYNINDITDTAISELQNNSEILNTLQTNLNELENIINNNDITNTLKDSLDSALNSLSNIDFPDVVKNIFSSLKELDLQGVKDFFKDILKIGATILCNNLDFLKNFLLGISINKNILSGLLIALLLSWLDRFCKEFTQEEQKNTSNKDIIFTMFPTNAIKIDSESAFSKFTNLYADYLKASSPLNLLTPLNTTDFLNNVTSGNISTALSNLRNSEITSSEKDNYLNILNTNLNSYSVNSPEYNNILKAKGELIKLPLISIERRDRNIRYSNLSDQLGSYLKQISNIDINSITTFNFSSIEQSLFNKMKELKDIANNSFITARPERSFDDFNFDSILPNLTTNEKNYLENLKYKSEAYKNSGIHSTTEIFYT